MQFNRRGTRQLDLICTSDTALDLWDADRIARMAICDGAKAIAGFSYEWDISGNCQMSKPIEVHARPPRDFMSRWITVDPRKTRVPIYVLMHVRCRRCPPCLKSRAQSWRYRAQAELQGAARTWFGSITCEPSYHYLAELEAIRRAEERAATWGALTPRERFLAHHNVISEDLTLWMKRVRKESGALLRYMLVCEAHQSGLPHYHCLVHEPLAAQSVRERTLRRQWPHGFTKFKLVNDGNAAAGYVTKYLNKAAEARVRASQRYGDPLLAARHRAKKGHLSTVHPTLDTDGLSPWEVGPSTSLTTRPYGGGNIL